MRVLFDTSVLVAALVEAHPNHHRALKSFTRTRNGETALVLCAHSLAELYAVLTRLPVRPRISPHAAWQLIHGNLSKDIEVIALTEEDYRATLQRMADEGLAGG